MSDISFILGETRFQIEAIYKLISDRDFTLSDALCLDLIKKIQAMNDKEGVESVFETMYDYELNKQSQDISYYDRLGEVICYIHARKLL